MTNTFKDISFAAAILSFSLSAYASGGINEYSSGNRPAKTLLAEALRTDKDSGYRCSAIEALGTNKDTDVAKELAGLLNDADPAVRACAIRAAGESKNEFAVKALLAAVESYQALGSRGAYEDNIQARLKAIDSIWSLGEIGDPWLMDALARFYAESDDVIKINLIISMGKLGKNEKTGAYILGIAASARETGVVRAAAFEMLERRNYPSAVAKLALTGNTGIEKGDLIYAGGMTGAMSGWVSPDLPVGHSGIFAGVEIKDGKINVIISDCVPNFFRPGGVRNIYSWYNFTHHFTYAYYGNRTTPVKPTPAQRGRIVKLALELGRKGLKYNNSHLSQKGPLEFDCVGYTEYIYERAGLNPTDNSYETGWGWPLTPWEQFASTKPNLPAGGAIVTHNKGGMIMPDQGIITRNFGSLLNTLDLKDQVRPPEISADIQPEDVN